MRYGRFIAPVLLATFLIQPAACETPVEQTTEMPPVPTCKGVLEAAQNANGTWDIRMETLVTRTEFFHDQNGVLRRRDVSGCATIECLSVSASSLEEAAEECRRVADE